MNTLIRTFALAVLCTCCIACKTSLPEYESFPKIDTHVHIRTTDPSFLEQSKSDHFQVQDREKVRNFINQYQDRLLYGTDLGASENSNGEILKTRIHQVWLNNQQKIFLRVWLIGLVYLPISRTILVNHHVETSKLGVSTLNIPRTESFPIPFALRAKYWPLKILCTKQGEEKSGRIWPKGHPGNLVWEGGSWIHNLLSTKENMI